MIAKVNENKYLATFHTQSAAIIFEKSLKSAGFYCKLKPVPRKLSSSCGICALFYIDDFKSFVTEDLECIYREEDAYFKIVFTNE